MKLVRSLRSRKLLKDIQRLSSFYDSGVDVREYQLNKLNSIWKEQCSRLPAYSAKLASGELPQEFESLEEYVSTIPIMDRRTLAANLSSHTVESPKPDAFRITGGSTAEPIRLPAWKREFRSVAASQWLGRYWFGIVPSDRLFMLWGHSHILGAGLVGKVNKYKRQVLDSVLGYRRISAYDLSKDALRRAGQQLIDSKPVYVYGYSVALDQLARANLDRREELRALNLRCVQATAERFPSSDSQEILEDLFACPVAMEYGAMETGHIAASSEDGNYRVYWRDYLVEGIQGDGGHHRVIVTSLFPRATPLMRYELGDTIRLHDDCSEIEHFVGVRSFLEVGGRCNYGIRLSDGSFFHSEVFTHCVRDLKPVEAFQLVQKRDRITVHYLAQSSLSSEEVGAARERFMKIDTRLREVEFERVSELAKSASGKTRMILNFCDES